MDGEIMSLDEILQDPYYMEQFNARIKTMTDGSLNTETADGRKTGGNMDIENTTAAGQETTTLQSENTQSTAANVDMTTIEQKAQERAERAAQGVVRDMLKQQGLDDEAVGKMLAEWKSKQVTPEQTIQALTGDLSAKDAEIAMLKQEKILRSHGLTDDEDIEVYSIRINKLAADGKDFEAAAKEYFEAHPRAGKAPATITYGGTGKTPLVPAEAEKQKILNDAKAAMRIK